jgi:hypothetical protein
MKGTVLLKMKFEVKKVIILDVLQLAAYKATTIGIIPYVSRGIAQPTMAATVIRQRSLITESPFLCCLPLI